MKYKEKEPEFNLKELRLKMLENAGNALAEGKLFHTHMYLNNFLDTIDEKSPAGIEMQKKLDDLQEWENGQKELLFHQTQTTDGFLEQYTTSEDGHRLIEHGTMRRLHDICYRVSLAFELINKD